VPTAALPCFSIISLEYLTSVRSVRTLMYCLLKEGLDNFNNSLPDDLGSILGGGNNRDRENRLKRRRERIV